MVFRNDIAGLRAFAVMPVLFFHAGSPWFQGGYLGVDVFFVISGYLITNLIYSKVANGKFTFLDFYDNRARRILPALMAVLTISTISAIFFMIPYDLKNYGQSLVASLFSANNILLYLTSGYWSLASGFKPLYHTWSLAVEEQYYFAAPLLIYYCFKINRSNLSVFIPIFLVLIASFLLSFNIQNREFIFLIIFPRAWELLAGALLALKKHNSQDSNNEFLSFLGLALILVSYFSPHLIAVNPTIISGIAVVGTLLVIAFSCGSKTRTGRFLSTKPLVMIGLISYSIYLWHQPILAFLRLSSEVSPGIAEQTAFSLLSLPFAYLSWRFVENPFRNRLIISPKLFYGILLLLSVILIGIGLLMHKTYGFQNYWPEYSYNGDPQSYVDAPMKFKRDSFVDNGKTKLLVVGNSFARDFINMMLEDGILSKFDLVYYDKQCQDDTRGELDTLLPKSEFVIYAGAWGMSGFSEEMVDSVAACSVHLHEKAVKGKVLVLGVKNFGWNNNFVKFKPSSEILNYKVLPLESVLEFNDLAKKRVKGYVDVLGLISTNKMVRIFDENGRFITYDTNHLTKNGAKYLGKILFTTSPLVELRDIAARAKSMN